MTRPFTVACVQNRATASPEQGVQEGAELSRRARERGAELICLPEYFGCLSLEQSGMHIGAHPEAEHPTLARMRELARELDGAWLLLGSIGVVPKPGASRCRNRQLLLDPTGGVVARYDKAHLFDVDLGEGQSYRESDTLEPGDEAVLARTPWGVLGMSICYDVRFAYLYRALAQGGADFLSVPAAFTEKTGGAHWHPLLRSRAIETGCYVFAPGQYGEHGRARTYGHSLIVDPWGEVLADAGDGPGFALAEVDPERVREARRRIPALTHDRTLRGPEPA